MPRSWRWCGLSVGAGSADRVVDGSGRAAPRRILRSAAVGCSSAADSRVLGCVFPRAHLHVVRRDNPNGAWAKSRRQRVVPLDFLVVQAFDDYEFERFAVPRAGESDFCWSTCFGNLLGRRCDRTRSMRSSPRARGGPD